MAPHTKKRRASVISISSGSPSPKGRAPVVCISSDDGSPPAKKRVVDLRPEKGKGKSPAFNPIGHRSRPSFDSGDSDDEDVLTATKQLELLRSWVDAGIEMAIREMAGGQSTPANNNTTPPQPRSDNPPPLSSMKPVLQITHKLPQSASYIGNTSRNINAHTSSSTTSYSSTQIQPPKSVSSNVPAPSKPREPLGQISNNVSAPIPTPKAIQSIALAREKSKPLPPNVILPPGDYLGFYDLVERYTVPQKASFVNDLTYHPAWRSWLEQLGIDEPQYQNAWDHRDRVWFKENTETAWAKEPLEKRRVIEKLAIWLKYGSFVNLHSIPLREPEKSLLPSSLVPFHELERNYFFNIRAFASHEDLLKQRQDWLFRIRFCEAQKYPLPQSPIQGQQLNDLYFGLHILQRKTIFSHAKFLKLLLKPPALSWGDLENNYEIYPASCFTSHAEYKAKRREWLRSLQLDSWPFSYVNVTEKYNEVAEVEWSEKSQETRTGIESHARVMKESLVPYAGSWSAVEDIFGFSLLVDFPGKQAEYQTTRYSWLKAIGMDDFGFSAPEDMLETQWAAKSFEEKQIILDKARTEKETFCSERLAQEATKAHTAEPSVIATTSKPANSMSVGSAPYRIPAKKRTSTIKYRPTYRIASLNKKTGRMNSRRVPF